MIHKEQLIHLHSEKEPDSKLIAQGLTLIVAGSGMRIPPEVTRTTIESALRREPTDPNVIACLQRITSVLVDTFGLPLNTVDNNANRGL